jgi:hypothetical protein
MDDELSVTLAEVYRMIRNQRQAHFEIQKMASATRLALKSVPGFEELYATHWASESQQLDGPHDAAMQILDRIIQGFEESG